MSLLLATDFQPEVLAQWVSQLQVELPGETFVTRRDPRGDLDIEAAFVANPARGALQGLPRLRFIQSMWAGVDKLLADPSVPTDVPLARMVDPAMNQAMAETALWAVLALHRDTFDYAAQQAAGRWQQHPQRRADELQVAVLGLGQMGRTVALRLAANGYRVSGWSTVAATLPGVDTRCGDAALAPLLAAADIVVNLLPLTERTRGLFDAATFARMRPGAGLVNLARGAHVVEADLLAALDAGQLGRAVLDVFQQEPLPSGHPLWSHPKVTVLPHVAAQTDLRSATRVAVANLQAWRAGRPVEHLVGRSRGY